MAVMTVSDTRDMTTDKSGAYLAREIKAAGHDLAGHVIVADEVAAIRAQLETWLADEGIHAIITTGGTGLTGRDLTPEAVTPFFEKKIEGFATVFHQVSFSTIGVSTLQSRACAGIARGTYIFCLPGSTGACRDAWENILVHEFNPAHKPCNLVELILRLGES